MFVKHTAGVFNRPHKRFVRFVASSGELQWGKKPFFLNKSIAVHAFVGVNRGRTTDAFKGAKAPREHCFTVASDDRTLDLEAPSEAIRDAWVHFLRDLMIADIQRQHAT
jgi:hypothetical protein